MDTARHSDGIVGQSGPTARLPAPSGLRAPIDKTLSMWPARCSLGIPATGADTSVSAHRVPRSGTSWWQNAVGLIDRAMFAAPKGHPETGLAELALTERVLRFKGAPLLPKPLGLGQHHGRPPARPRRRGRRPTDRPLRSATAMAQGVTKMSKDVIMSPATDS